jgi:hypothetical protein
MRSRYEHIRSFIGGIHDDIFMCCVWPLLVHDEANKGLWTHLESVQNLRLISRARKGLVILILYGLLTN